MAIDVNLLHVPPIVLKAGIDFCYICGEGVRPLDRGRIGKKPSVVRLASSEPKIPELLTLNWDTTGIARQSTKLEQA